MGTRYAYRLQKQNSTKPAVLLAAVCKLHHPLTSTVFIIIIIIIIIIGVTRTGIQLW